MHSLDSHGFSMAELRAAANAPEVHAAAILAAKDYLLSRGEELHNVASSDLAGTIAMHAALIMRGYLDAIGSPDLIHTVAKAKVAD